MVGTTGVTGTDGTEQVLSILLQTMAVAVAMAPHSRSQGMVTAADATELHGQLADVDVQEQAGLQTDAAAGNKKVDIKRAEFYSPPLLDF